MSRYSCRTDVFEINLASKDLLELVRWNELCGVILLHKSNLLFRSGIHESVHRGFCVSSRGLRGHNPSCSCLRSNKLVESPEEPWNIDADCASQSLAVICLQNIEPINGDRNRSVITAHDMRTLSPERLHFLGLTK